MRKIVKILLVLFVLVIVALVVCYIWLGSIIRTGVETIGPEATGTEVTLADVDVSLFSGRAGLGGFVIGSPEGFVSENAFKLGEVGVYVDVDTVMDDVIIVESILIDGAEITWEGWAGNNHKRIMENINKYSGGEAKKEEKPEPEETGGPAKKVVIEDFKFQNSFINVVIGGKQIANIKFPNLHLTGIGRKEGGLTVKEALEQLYEQIFRSQRGSVTENLEMLNKKAEELKAKGEEILREGKETLEKGKEAIRKGDLESVKEDALKAKDGILKDLLK